MPMDIYVITQQGKKGERHTYTHSYTIVFKGLEVEELELRENGISSVSMK